MPQVDDLLSNVLKQSYHQHQASLCISHSHFTLLHVTQKIHQQAVLQPYIMCSWLHKCISYLS